MASGMESIANFLATVDAFCTARGISEARASTLILNGGRRIAAIRSGTSDIGALTLEKAMQWLSDHWPDPTPWPSSIPRPSKSDGAPLSALPNPTEPTPAKPKRRAA